MYQLKVKQDKAIALWKGSDNPSTQYCFSLNISIGTDTKIDKIGPRSLDQLFAVFVPEMVVCYIENLVQISSYFILFIFMLAMEVQPLTPISLLSWNRDVFTNIKFLEFFPSNIRQHLAPLITNLIKSYISNRDKNSIYFTINIFGYLPRFSYSKLFHLMMCLHPSPVI